MSSNAASVPRTIFRLLEKYLLKTTCTRSCPEHSVLSLGEPKDPTPTELTKEEGSHRTQVESLLSSPPSSYTHFHHRGEQGQAQGRMHSRALALTKGRSGQVLEGLAWSTEEEEPSWPPVSQTILFLRLLPTLLLGELKAASILSWWKLHLQEWLRLSGIYVLPPQLPYVQAELDYD